MRRRILLLVTGITVLVVLAFAVPLAFLVRSAVEQRSERSIRDQAQSVASFVGYGSPTEASVRNYLSTLEQNDNRSTSVRMPDNTVLGTEHEDAGGGPQPSDDGETPGSGDPGEGGGGPIGGPPKDAQVRSVPGGKVAELPVRTEAGTYLISVFASTKSLDAGVGAWYALILGGSAGLLLIGVLGGELLTRRIVRPLTRTAQTAHQLSEGDVSARAPTSGPREIAQVGTALNLLADRIDELIAEERETVADMSHRMRTPLTALRLDAEGLQRPGRGRADRRARHGIGADADRGHPRRTPPATRRSPALGGRHRGRRLARHVLVGAGRRSGTAQRNLAAG